MLWDFMIWSDESNQIDNHPIIFISTVMSLQTIYAPQPNWLVELCFS